MTATWNVRGSVAVITLDNPPVNGLGHATRRAVFESIERAEADPAVVAIVITGAGKAFSGGADIKEFGTPQALAEPHLHALIGRVEAASKPVVAAIHSVCMGGGLELALGCHYRLASPGANVALPEVKLGLLPGAGGTQRLPRALGVETALKMIVGGVPAKSEALARVPGQHLFDRIVEGDLVDGAVAFCAEIDAARPLPRVRDLPCAVVGADPFAAAREAARARRDNPIAPGRCIDCVQQATKLPFEDGLRYERDAFLALMQSPESRALRHAFFAERATTKIPDVPESTPVRSIRQVAIVGAGTMGRGIALCLLEAGLAVVLLERSEDALARGLAALHEYFATRVASGKTTEARAAEQLARVRGTLRYADLADVDLAIEAVFEDLSVKQRVFEELDAVLKPGAILATNTSTLDVNRIAAFTRRPQDVIGTHFFSPAQVMRLLEVVRGARTAPEVLATSMKLGKQIGKTCVVAGVCDGFIGNRMIEQYLRQAGFLLDEGATPTQVDRAIEAFGFAMGPFRMSDLAGNDVGHYIRQRRAIEKPDVRYSGLPDRLCGLGRFGQKTGAGWHDYTSGRREARPAWVVEEMIAAYRAEIGLATRAIGDEEIVQRLVYALVNEGARILEEGIALRSSDIDIVYIAGYGFPAWRGGPMWHADAVGLDRVVETMKRFAENPHADPTFWHPAPMLARRAAEGRALG